MKKSFAALLFVLVPVCAQAAPDATDPGLLSRASPYPVAETTRNLAPISGLIEATPK